jgi:hypothetical protein
MMVLTCVARLFPHLNCVILLVGNRISAATFQERMEAMAITGMRLQVRACCIKFAFYTKLHTAAAAAAEQQQQQKYQQQQQKYQQWVPAMLFGWLATASALSYLAAHGGHDNHGHEAAGGDGRQ